MSLPARACRRPRRAARPALRASFLAVALCLASIPAVGAEPVVAEATEDACLRDSECLQHYQSARQLSRSGQNEAALAEYQRAYQRLPVPRLLYSIARLQHRLGLPQAALASYQRFLATTLADDEQLRVKAREYQAQLVTTPAPAPGSTDGEHAQVAASTSGPLTAAPAHQPVYKKWWLWTLVGAAAAGAITATVVATYPREPAIPGSAQSYAPMF